jgi:hypothetical protein
MWTDRGNAGSQISGITRWLDDLLQFAVGVRFHGFPHLEKSQQFQYIERYYGAP